MSTAESWELTPREFAARLQVRDHYLENWALERADFRNAHFHIPGVQWEARDFLGSSDITQRIAQAKADAQAVKLANMQIEMMKAKKGSAGDLPSWAQKTW